jgi:hypothetical protein
MCRYRLRRGNGYQDQVQTQHQRRRPAAFHHGVVALDLHLLFSLIIPDYP